MNESIFRMNDIRGIIDVDMSAADMGRIATGFACYMTAYSQERRCVVGRDGRTHSPAIHAYVCQALQSHGFDVVDIGVVPTPLVHFALHTLVLEWGLMITASHNGPEYNGCKIVRHKGVVWGAQLEIIKQCVRNGCSHTPAGHGSYFFYGDIVKEYIASLVRQFPQLHKSAERIVFDCGSGATSVIMPLLTHAMDWQGATLLYADLDGQFPHHPADPVMPENMQALAAEVRLQNAKIGIGFDGDGDRMAAVTSAGQLVRGDHLIALFAADILRTAPGAPVVYDIKCSSLVKKSILEAQGVPCESPSGHALIRAMMQETGAVFGGELSCHFFFNDREASGYDDAIYASLRLLDVVRIAGKTFADVVDTLPLFYATDEWRVPCTEEHKLFFMNVCERFTMTHYSPEQISRRDGVRVETQDGWWLVRPSQTQPVICIRAEGYCATGLTRIAAQLHDMFIMQTEGRVNEALFEAWIATAQHTLPLLCAPEKQTVSREKRV